MQAKPLHERFNRYFHVLPNCLPMRCLSAAVCLLCITIGSQAQNNFSPGCLVLRQGDTLRAFLKEEIKNDILHTIKFTTNSKSASFQSFTTDQAKCFKYDEGDLYQSISFMNSGKDSIVNESCFAAQLVRRDYDLFVIVEEEKSYFVHRSPDVSKRIQVIKPNMDFRDSMESMRLKAWGLRPMCRSDCWCSQICATNYCCSSRLSELVIVSNSGCADSR